VRALAVEEWAAQVAFCHGEAEFTFLTADARGLICTYAPTSLSGNSADRQ